MIQALIFDMDGTIVDNMRVHTAVWLEVLAEFGINMTPLQFQAATAGNTNGELLRKLIDPQMSEARVAEIAHEKETRYRERFRPFLQPVAGLEPLLQQAQQANVTLAVATAANQPNIQYVLDGLDLRRYFATVVGADDVKRGKPEPDLFLLVAARLGLSPEVCLVFEDSLAGLEKRKIKASHALRTEIKIRPLVMPTPEKIQKKTVALAELEHLHLQNLSIEQYNDSGILVVEFPVQE